MTMLWLDTGATVCMFEAYLTRRCFFAAYLPRLLLHPDRRPPRGPLEVVPLLVSVVAAPYAYPHFSAQRWVASVSPVSAELTHAALSPVRPTAPSHQQHLRPPSAARACGPTSIVAGSKSLGQHGDGVLDRLAHLQASQTRAAGVRAGQSASRGAHCRDVHRSVAPAGRARAVRLQERGRSRFRFLCMWVGLARGSGRVWRANPN